MSSIGSISSSVSYMGYADSLRRQAPDPSKIADTIFSKLDSKGQGFLEVSDLQSALTNLSSSGSSTTISTDANQPDASDLFKKLDGNGDGKLTKSEFSDGLKALAQQFESQFNSSRTSYADGVQGGQRPPGPPPGVESGGLNKSQLSGLASQVAQSDSKAGSDLNSVAQNFDAADTNQDGKVSLQETLAYLDKQAEAKSANSVSGTEKTDNSASSTSSDSTSAASKTNNDSAIFKQVLQLLQAYADPFQLGGQQNSSNGISVTA